MNEFTTQQLDDFWHYERVRAKGRYNMFEPRARKSAGLTEDEYRFVMRNYAALKDAALATPKNMEVKSE